MANFVFNVAKGRIAHYCSLPGTDDGLVLVLLRATGLQGDASLMDAATLADILGSNTEMSFTGYARRALMNVAVTVDQANDRVNITADNPGSWTNTSVDQAAGKAILCYDPDINTGSDSQLIPLFGWDYSQNFPNGVGITLKFNPSGVGRAS